MRRFLCAVSACALALAMITAYGQGKKEDAKEEKSSRSNSMGQGSSRSSSTSSSSSRSSQSSSSQSVGRSSQSSNSSGSSRSSGSDNRSSQGGSSSYNSGSDRSRNGQSSNSGGRNYNSGQDRGNAQPAQGGGQRIQPDSMGGGRNYNGGQDRSPKPVQGQSNNPQPSPSMGGGRNYNSGQDRNPKPVQGQGTSPTMGSGRSNNNGGQGQQIQPDGKRGDPSQGRSGPKPVNGQGAQPSNGPIVGGRDSNPGRDRRNPKPVQGSNSAPGQQIQPEGKGSNPRLIGPPVQTGGTPVLGGGRSGQTGPGPNYNPRTGGPKPTEDNHNWTKPTSGRTGPLPVQDLRARGFDGKGIPAPVNAPRGDDWRWKVKPVECYPNWNLRHGYCSYDPSWCDWFFGYRFYYFDPRPDYCVFSPYYGYYCVPGYISLVRCWLGRVIIIAAYGDPCNWNYCGRGYTYNFYSSYSEPTRNNFTPLDRALSSLSDAFKYGDEKMLDRLVQRGGQVDVFIDDEYAYSMNADDYYDITSDLVKNVATTNFSIVQVKKSQDNGYIVVARHDYRDSFNIDQTNWLTFTLREDRGQYFIVQAGTSKARPSY